MRLCNEIPFTLHEQAPKKKTAFCEKLLQKGIALPLFLYQFIQSKPKNIPDLLHSQGGEKLGVTAEIQKALLNAFQALTGTTKKGFLKVA